MLRPHPQRRMPEGLTGSRSPRPEAQTESRGTGLRQVSARASILRLTHSAGSPEAAPPDLRLPAQSLVVALALVARKALQAFLAHWAVQAPVPQQPQR